MAEKDYTTLPIPVKPGELPDYGPEAVPEPSLQAVPSEHGIIAVPDPSLQAVPKEDGMIAVSDPSLETSHDVGEGSSSSSHSPKLFNGEDEIMRRKKRRRRYFLIASVVAVIIIVAAVLGGVLGSRASRKDSPSLHQTSPPEPSNISPDSPLGVAGFSDAILLTYQAPDGSLKFSRASLDEEDGGTSWSDSQSINIVPKEGDLSKLMMVAVSNQTRNDSIHMQFDLFYLNQESTINSLIYDYQDPEFGFWAGNINSQGIKALEGSHVAVQWPWLIFQNYQGNIGYTSFELIDDPPSPPKNPLDGFWMKVNPFNTKSPAMDRSKLAVVPLSRNYTFIDCSMWALVYQDRNGQLRAQPNDGNAAGKVTEEEWKEINNRTDDIVELWSETFPSIRLQDRASFTAFSVARDSNQANDDVDVFILYQDDSNDIKQVKTNGKGWEESSPEALKAAEKDTDIACIAQATWNSQFMLNDRTFRQDEQLLSTAGPLTRCYFRRNGSIVEVRLTEKGWSELGTVPIS